MRAVAIITVNCPTCTQPLVFDIALAGILFENGFGEPSNKYAKAVFNPGVIVHECKGT